MSTARPARKTHVIRAPGRVNLIGEHTDYNDGFVFPMGIEPEIRVVCRQRGDGRVRLASTLFPDAVTEFSFQRDASLARRQGAEANERWGFFVHELRNALGTSMLAVAGQWKRWGTMTLP